ncbi:FtsX-like permease family protein [Nocardioides sp. Kera G14]|uniref:FtsX-like permease family protein n=1 Tax=Nocardioides sp. Kera G14 TaxID=2884264 RepID=UPI001D11A4C5|nr:FtsX-like permease family protein [Nocardioides sp. Kera G14]UDY24802.1 FtsX-like permease family protein [Nocardioides sp. Kera G14]
MKFGLAYGILSSRRRAKEMLLPAVTTATGAFLVVIVFAMSAGIKKQSASLGHADEMGRAIVLIAVTVLLVGVVEVAVSTTRTIAHRAREIGVLGANGVPARPVVTALLVEPVVAAVAGALGGAVLAAVVGFALDAAGMASSGVSWSGTLQGVLIAVGVSIVAAIVTSIVPTYRAVNQPPIKSLTA